MRQYSYEEVQLLVNGVELRDLAEGDDSVTLERREDAFRDAVGVDGTMIVIKRSDRSGVCVIKCQQSGAATKHLSDIYAIAENGGFVPVYIQMKDLLGNDLASGTKGYITGPASMVRGEGVNDPEWTIVVERLDLLHGEGATL